MSITDTKRHILLLSLLALVLVPSMAQEAQNRPYIDDKIFHFGFQLGVNFSSFGVTDSQLPVIMRGEGDILHARVSGMTPGFHVGFVTDLRMNKYFSLRFCPGMQFASRSISYVSESGRDVFGYAMDIDGKPVFGSHMDVLYMPIYLPLYIKFSAMREGNYRPYVIAGGGASFNVSRDINKPVLLNTIDYFCEFGFGVDLYFRWFKWCPEITYRLGFANQLCPADKHPQLPENDAFYTNAISRLQNHCICLTFNFE